MIARTRGLPSERHSNVRAISAQGGSEADLGRKVKTALDETRLLILGAQVLFGFQLNAVFQDAFASLAQSTRLLACAGQLLMVIAIALLIAPSMQHQIVERGSDTVRIHGVTSLFAGVALLPFGLSLGIGLYIVLHHLYGPPAALAGGTTFFVLAAFCWYGLGMIVNPHNRMQRMQREQEKPTPLSTKIDQMLVEARIIIPGGQALLGFQLTVKRIRAAARKLEAYPCGGAVRGGGRRHFADDATRAAQNLLCGGGQRLLLPAGLLVRDGGTSAARAGHRRRSLRGERQGCGVDPVGRGHRNCRLHPAGRALVRPSPVSSPASASRRMTHIMGADADPWACGN